MDPSYGKARYTDIKPVATKYGLDLKVQFQRNGENLDQVNGEVQRAAERAARATGLTFGLVGSTVTDACEINIEYTDDKGASTSRAYMHALHTTVGNKKAPIQDVQPTSAADGFATIIEETILNFLKEMQDSGKLVWTAVTAKWRDWRLAAN